MVAADYVGLRVEKDTSGQPIGHEYLASSSHAHDIFYSVQAAQTSFPKLSKHLVIIGHSQGGSATWAVAQRQAIEPFPGYLGAVAVSPATKIIHEPMPIRSVLRVGMLPGIADAFPDFNINDVVAQVCEQRVNLIMNVLCYKPYTSHGWTAASSIQLGGERPSIC